MLKNSTNALPENWENWPVPAKLQMLERIEKGDRVVTIGGIHGEVVSLSDESVIVNVDPKTDATLKLSRSAISRIVPEDEDAREA